jgi:hypothetical protein
MLDDRDITPEDAKVLDELKERYGVWALRAYFRTGERLADRRRSVLLGDVQALPEVVIERLEQRFAS